jgi:hypothetical protein
VCGHARCAAGDFEEQSNSDHMRLMS